MLLKGGRYALPAEIAPEAARATLARTFGIRPAEQGVVIRRYVDTVDGRLLRHGTVLLIDQQTTGSRVRWERVDDGGLLSRCALDRLPRLLRDWPAGPMRERLYGVVGWRALLPLLDVRHHEAVWCVRDDEDKMVARVVVESDIDVFVSSRGEIMTLPAGVRVLPVRGYAEAAAHAARIVVDRLDVCPGPPHLLHVALERMDRPLPEPLFSLRAGVSPDLRADEAIKQVLGRLWQAMKQTEQGLRADLDPQFLIDFRTALRRSLSLLGGFKGALYGRDVDAVRRAMKRLDRLLRSPYQLNAVGRHLDACLAHGLPAEGVEALLARIADRYRREHSQLLETLDAGWWSRLEQTWAAYLDHPVPPLAIPPDATRPMRDVAGERVAALHRQIVRRVRALDASPSVSQMRKLQRECRRLNGWMTLLGDLFDERRLTRHLPSVGLEPGAWTPVSMFEVEGLRAIYAEEAAAGATVDALLRDLDARAEALSEAFLADVIRFTRRPVRRAYKSLKPA